MQMLVHVLVEVVEDDDLPEGVDRVLVERPGREPILLVKRCVSGTLRLLGARERHLRAV